MSASRYLTGAALAGALVVTGACVTDPVTGERKISTKGAIGAGVGAIGGYLLGDLIGGRRDRTEKIIGAGIGAIAGGAVGVYMDRQQRELEEATEGTGVVVEREGDELLLRMPSGITFAYDRYDIQPRFRSTLDEVADTLQRFPSTYIDVYGHTDSTGSDEYNQGLSERRAQSVADYLAMRGVQRARIATQGFGETQPIASNATDEGRAANRRVDIRIVPIEESDVARY